MRAQPIDRLGALLLAVGLLFSLPTGIAFAQQSDCGDGHALDHAFTSGASWSLCLSLDASRGLSLQAVSYRAPGDSRRMVLAQLHPAQLLLHRHDESRARAQIDPSTPSSDPIVLGYLLGLDSRQCTGTLLSVSGHASAVCMSIDESRLLAKYASRQAIHGSALTIQSTLQRGTLTWTTRYTLTEDGAIRPALVLSGRVSNTLSTPSTDEPDVASAPEHAQRLSADLPSLPRFTVLANWRMVFDLDTPEPDRVEQIEFVLDPTTGYQRAMQVDTLGRESWLDVNRETFRGWRVLDNRGAGYYLDPANSGFDYVNADLPWAEHVGAVSRWRDCEYLAMNNPVTDPDPVTQEIPYELETTLAGSDCGESLSDFINDEELGDTVVLWHSLSRTVSPTPEDWPVLRDRLLSFELLPFDWTAASPFETEAP